MAGVARSMISLHRSRTASIAGRGPPFDRAGAAVVELGVDEERSGAGPAAGGGLGREAEAAPTGDSGAGAGGGTA